jgi:colanic acid/amylovoran biosynthesis glycosyltransferase
VIAVAHAVKTWLPRTQVWLYQQLRHLPAHITSHVVCDRLENAGEFPLPNVHALRDRSRLLYLEEVALRRYDLPNISAELLALSRAGVRVLHSHFGKLAWNYSWTARLARMRHIVSFYGVDISYLPQSKPLWRWRYRKLFASVERVLVEGPFMAKTAEALGCPPEKLRVQRLGVSLDQIPYRPRRMQRGEPLRILIAAAFREKKGIPYALEAIARLHRAGVPLAVTIIGDSTPPAEAGDDKAKIQATIAEHGLEPIVRMLGFVPYARLLEEAATHHIYMSPSVTAHSGDTEGGAPIGLIEMAASGMPVVSTYHCDIPQILAHRETGLLAAERDVGGLVDALQWLVEHPDDWDRMTAAARAHISAKFDVRTQARGRAEIYEEMGT